LSEQGPGDRRAAEHNGARRGRPPSTSRRELQLIALRLFAERGFDDTTIEQIAAEAGVSERTFFRYFATKASVLWSEFETEVETIRSSLAAAPDDLPMMVAIRGAVVAANHYHADDVPEMRMRMHLIASVPALSFGAAEHYDAWERAISEFAGRRLGQPADSLYALAVGRAALAACRAAYDRWSARADADLTIYLDAALSALAAGFAPEALRATLITPLKVPGGPAHTCLRHTCTGGKPFAYRGVAPVADTTYRKRGWTDKGWTDMASWYTGRSSMGWSAKAVIAVTVLAVLLIAAVPAALFVGVILMLLGHVVGGLALFGASVLAAVTAVVVAGLSGVQHLRKLVSRQRYRIVQLQRGEYFE